MLYTPGHMAGLIPARAGSTAPTVDSSLEVRAHPRPCGEHQPCEARVYRRRGSSPPVRGAHTVDGVSAVSVGLIPARAGSTIPTFGNIQLTRAHPRPCGEHLAVM